MVPAIPATSDLAMCRLADVSVWGPLVGSMHIECSFQENLVAHGPHIDAKES